MRHILTSIVIFALLFSKAGGSDSSPDHLANDCLLLYQQPERKDGFSVADLPTQINIGSLLDGSQVVAILIDGASEHNARKASTVFTVGYGRLLLDGMTDALWAETIKQCYLRISSDGDTLADLVKKPAREIVIAADIAIAIVRRSAHTGTRLAYRQNHGLDSRGFYAFGVSTRNLGAMVGYLDASSGEPDMDASGLIRLLDRLREFASAATPEERHLQEAKLREELRSELLEQKPMESNS
jgi:hypothetical protein